MNNKVKKAIKINYLKLFNYNIPNSLQEENSNIKSELIQLNKVYCVLNFDDLSPLPDKSNHIGRGGDINDEISIKFLKLLNLFPNLGVTHFVVPNFHPSDNFYLFNKYSILNKSNTLWLEYYLDLKRKFNIEFACHGLHHRQYNNFLFSRNTEFAYTDYNSSLKLLKSSIELFVKAGLNPIGFRPPGWDINSDFSIIESIKDAGLKYGALNSYDGGLNANINRVSNTHPVLINDLVNFPDNINIDWPIELIKSEIKKLIDFGGIISIKCHFSKAYLTNSFSDVNYNKLISVLNHIINEYKSDVEFATFKNIYFEILKLNKMKNIL